MKNVCLVASSGGHLAELASLRQAWSGQRTTWVTFPTCDARSLLGGEHVVWAHFPTNRNVLNLLRNTLLAWRLLRAERPDLIISTGAGVAVPFIWIGRLLRIRTVFIESLTFTHRRSLSGSLVYHLVDHYFVQWPDLAEKYSKAIYAGQVL